MPLTMKIPLVLCACLFVVGAENAAHNAQFHGRDLSNAVSRSTRQTQTDLTVRTIIEWLQGKYSPSSNKVARDSSAAHSEPARTYLPVPEGGSERPRPFQPNPTPTPSPSRPPYNQLPDSSINGYPQQPRPQPPFQEQQTNKPNVYLPPNPSEEPPYPTSGGNGLQIGLEGSGGVEQVPIGSTGSGSVEQVEEDLHPPHIHQINVLCSKTEMTIDIEFNREFNGVIYSKGYFREPGCIYVQKNSGRKEYSFTVKLDSCGTQFINNFKDGGQAYLENVLILQNEPGIQEVWDSAQRVRCLWEGLIKQAVKVDLNVDMLNQETVTFSGDTASAQLSIQMGKGPYAPAANGLVKIGETMTLVITVTGDPGFDIQVRKCVAKDADGTNEVDLTDDRGCILRPKLMGAFQKAKGSGASSDSVIAYSFFQAFKFPDIMDLTFECNVELCKTDCEGCPEPGQNTNPLVRRRRDLWKGNETLGQAMKVFHSFKVISPEDIEDLPALTNSGATIINVGSSGSEGICLSMPGFLLAITFLLSVLLGSCLLTAYLWLKEKRAVHGRHPSKLMPMDILQISKS